MNTLFSVLHKIIIMARKINPNSKRQIAFKIIEENKQKSRKEIISLLKKELEINDIYASNLYNTYRNEKKETGEMEALFKVVVDKSGRPKVRKYFSFNVGELDGKTPEEAVEKFMSYLKTVSVQENNEGII